MSDLLYCAALLMLFVAFFAATKSRNKFRDRADEAEFTVGLQKIEIAHLKEKLEGSNAKS